METEENINGGEEVTKLVISTRAEAILEEMKAANGKYKAGLDNIEPGTDEFVEEVDAVEPVLAQAEQAADDQLTKLAIEEAEDRAK